MSGETLGWIIYIHKHSPGTASNEDARQRSALASRDLAAQAQWRDARFDDLQ
jgi:hypothetical protein